MCLCACVLENCRMCRRDIGRSSFCFGGGSVNWEVFGNGTDFSSNVTGCSTNWTSTDIASRKQKSHFGILIMGEGRGMRGDRTRRHRHGLMRWGVSLGWQYRQAWPKARAIQRTTGGLGILQAPRSCEWHHPFLPLGRSRQPGGMAPEMGRQSKMLTGDRVYLIGSKLPPGNR
jgi:hypothetical protein